MRELKQDWRDIFLAFRIARDPRKVVLGAVGVILSLAFLYVLAWFFHDVIKVISHNASEDIRWRTLHVLKDPLQFVQAAFDLCISHLSIDAWIFLIVLGVGFLLIWSYFGGAISRIAAVELARDERIEIREAHKFACRKYWAYLWAPIVPALGVVFFGLLIFLGALVGCIPVAGDFFIGIFFPAALLFGFLIAVVLVGGVAGAGLMMPAISAEGTDSFDGISRAYSYVYSRPWRFVWYFLVALGYCLVCAAVVYLFVWLTVEATLFTGKVGLKALYGRKKFDDIYSFYMNWKFIKGQYWWTDVAAFLVGIWAHLLWALFLGFVASLKITAWTIIYYLMRKAVDGTEMTEVFTEEPEGETTPETAPATPAGEKKEGEQTAAADADNAQKKSARKKKEGEEGS